MATSPEHSPKHTIPYRQIRALYDEETITVYQAYSSSIALAAVEHQKLNASPDFKLGRMTWIKPSWCWMMYRSGYSFKDTKQSHILALKLTHSSFLKLLNEAVICHGQTLTSEDRKKDVRVQWDPERSPTLEVLSYRSIQIGISGAMARWWVEEGIVGIEDVTEKARGLWEFVEGEKRDGKGGKLGIEEGVERGLMPREREYVVSEEVRGILMMGED
ncbi:hypothetical protein L207DRAFT_573414 [Hyaloscypha variabilis F]|uniref:ATP-dependent RNA helicase DHX8 n=1 Tax=Hyaloscypha variabilis (strain UAMH 11265 / GT02V1 / F) TaxID=1149755 RepID=A0A2J6QWE7_HYAVF|nr:hypothetical protein L207DRAFT_573414 [Hyaloscypha variabilis F]